MPLFGKKNKSDKTGTNTSGQPSYPSQSAVGYPTQNYGASSYPQGQVASAPPPYSAAAPPIAAQGQPMPGPPYQMSVGPPMYGYPPQQPMPGQPMYNYPPQQTVMVQGGFDAGARFDPNSRPTIPPPPPGAMLHPAQMAAMQGSNVVVTQRKGDFWTGGSDGGFTLGL